MSAVAVGVPFAVRHFAQGVHRLGREPLALDQFVRRTERVGVEIIEIVELARLGTLYVGRTRFPQQRIVRVEALGFQRRQD